MSIFRNLILTTLFSALAGIVQAATFSEQFPEIAADPEFQDVADLLKDLDFQTGKVFLPNNLATLDQGEDYYFLGHKDTRYVLEDLWGNPPDETVLGMVFPSHATPFHDTWGMVLSFEDIGHVSDKDAAGYDYASLLETMKKDTRAENQQRAAQGFGTIELIGWAEPPHYDADTRKLYWAKELRFNDSDPNTLNYDIRVLGRTGVLVMNIIAEMTLLEQVKQDAPGLLAMTSFNQGSRYEDFDPSVDKVAAVGIGGLIAGKVLAKTGFLAVALVFLKKFWFLLFLPLVWLKNLVFRKAE